MQVSLADTVGDLPRDKQGAYLCQRYKDGLDLGVILSFDVSSEETSYVPDLTTLFEYILLEEGVLTRDRCASFMSLLYSGHLPALNRVLINNHMHYRMHFFLCTAADFFKFLYNFYNSLSLEQVLVIAQQLAPSISYVTQIDTYLEDLDEISEDEFKIVSALAQAGDLSLKELADQFPVLFNYLKDDV